MTILILSSPKAFSDKISVNEIGDESGLIYYNSEAKSGWIASGLSSIIRGSYEGIMLSGAINFTGGEFFGFQGSGLLNYSKNFRKGLQLAPINISEKNEGVPLGLFSYVHEQGLSYDLWTDETGFINTGLRSGNGLINNILFIAYRPGKDYMLSFGAEAGLKIDLGSKFYLNLDISSQNIQRNIRKFSNDLNVISRIRIIAGYRIHNNLSILFGPNINGYVSSENSGDEFIPYSILNYTEKCECNSDIWQKYWIGFSIGFRY